MRLVSAMTRPAAVVLLLALSACGDDKTPTPKAVEMPAAKTTEPQPTEGSPEMLTGDCRGTIDN